MRKYIDAEKIKQTFCAECNHTLKCEDCDIDYHFRYAPAADMQEVKHGRWIEADDMPRLDNTFSIRCSLCGQLMLAHPNDENPNFCCNCGAKMDEVGE